MIAMERSQSQQRVWPTANEIDGDVVDNSTQSHLLTKENRRLLVQYFTSRTSSTGQTRQRNASFHGDFDNARYHDEWTTRHHVLEYPPVTNPVTNGNHHVTSSNHRVTNDNHHENYRVVRRHYSRQHSVGGYDDGYYGNDELQPHHRYGHYKSCNVIGSVSHDPARHLSQSRSVYNIHSNYPATTNVATHSNHLSSTNLTAHSNHITQSSAAVRPNHHLTKSPSSLAVHASGIEYICNFTSTHKVVNSRSRSAQDLRRVSWHGDFQLQQSATANDTPTRKRRNKRHKKCLIM